MKQWRQITRYAFRTILPTVSFVQDAIVLNVFGKMFIDVPLAPVGLTMMENLWNILLLANLENP